jgi:hypothetical protein
MKRQWKKAWVKATMWIVTEIVLNLLGLDNLADYSEFLFEKEITFAIHQPQIVIASPSRNSQFNYDWSYRSPLLTSDS